MRRFGHHTNTRGVVGHAAGITSVKELFYLSQGDTEGALREVAGAGYHGVELFDGDVLCFPGGVTSLKRVLTELGLDLVAVYAGANFIFADALADELWRIQRAAEAASNLGATQFMIGGGARRARGTIDSDYVALAMALDRVSEMTADVELIASFHPHLGTCVETPNEIERILSLSQIRFCPDTAHLAAGGSDVLELLRLYAERISYIHLKDYVVPSYQAVPLGQGELDVASVLATLDANGFDGWITIEADGYAGDPTVEMAESKRFLASLSPEAA